jgi:hypothetical protein
MFTGEWRRGLQVRYTTFLTSLERQISTPGRGTNEAVTAPSLRQRGYAVFVPGGLSGRLTFAFITWQYAGLSDINCSVTALSSALAYDVRLSIDY